MPGIGAFLEPGAYLDNGQPAPRDIAPPRPPERSCEVLFLLDRSGSMDPRAADAVAGFNRFVGEQRAAAQPDAQMSLILFDDQYEVPIAAGPLAGIPRLTRATFEPRGSTAILDALGRTIGEGMIRHGVQGHPRRTLVVLLTDGEENASHEYARPTIKAMVERARNLFGWEFVLIGVGMDAERLARDIGILPHLALPVKATKAGMREAFLAASRAAQAAARGEEIRLLGGK
jgi:Mg-chelatase subunit ChlD